MRVLKAGHAFGETTELFPRSYVIPRAKIQPGTYRNITGNTALAWAASWSPSASSCCSPCWPSSLTPSAPAPRSDGGRPRPSLIAGVCYVAVTLATGMPAGAAALYDGHRGGELATAVMVTDVRTFAFYLSLLVLGLQALALGIAARSDRFSRRWTGIGGVVVGLLLFAGVAGAGLGLHDYASMVWMIWWIGVAIALFRNAPTTAVDARS